MNFSMLDSSLDQAAQRTATTEIESITSPPGAEAGRGEAEPCGHGRSELSMTVVRATMAYTSRWCSV
jgi:hypothetical protein